MLLLYACAHKISLKYLFLQKKLPSKYVVKYASSVTHFVWQIYFPNEFQIKNIKYIHRNLRYYETKVQLLYLSGNHLPLVMIYKNKMVTLKNLILKYIGMKNINILKRKCHVGINVVVFLEVILKLCDVCFMKNIVIIYKWPIKVVGLGYGR